MTGHVADHVDVAAGSVQASSAGTVSVMSGDDLSVSAEGDMVGVASGAIDVWSGSFAGRVSDDLSGTVGGDASMTVGGGLSLGAGGSGSAMFGDGVSVVGSSVLIEGGDRLIGAAAEVAVTGSENVRVASIGSIVELSGSGELEYSMFVWRSSEAFDEYTNSVPLVSDVEEMIIRASVPGSIRAV